VGVILLLSDCVLLALRKQSETAVSETAVSDLRREPLVCPPLRRATIPPDPSHQCPVAPLSAISAPFAPRSLAPESTRALR